MYANPWHFHHTGQFVLVVWLMLMEDNGKIEASTFSTGVSEVRLQHQHWIV